MKILVCIKQVPGTAQVEIDEETGVLKRSGVAAKMNPYDLYALETAMQIKQKNAAEVHALTMGPPQAKSILQEAYMMGADKAALLTDRKFAGADVLATSFTLAQGIKKMCVVDLKGLTDLVNLQNLSNLPDLIICGKMTTDGDTAQVGPQIAEFLGIPHIANVCEIVEVKQNSIVVKADLPTTVEMLEVKFPCLITVEKGIYQPRLPSFRLKIKTQEREILHFALEDLADKDEMRYGLNGSPTKVKCIFPPDENTTHEIWRDEGQVIGDKLYEKICELKFL